jgi:hypothetical protein
MSNVEVGMRRRGEERRGERGGEANRSRRCTTERTPTKIGFAVRVQLR